jgi:LysR family nitrogen assimilation transcriptional regulator
MIKIRQIQFFLSVLQYNSFVKATESLNVLLQSVSKVIRELEEILQVKLITRHTNGIEITEYASFLENYSHLILKGISNAEKEI